MIVLFVILSMLLPGLARSGLLWMSVAHGAAALVKRDRQLWYSWSEIKEGTLHSAQIYSNLCQCCRKELQKKLRGSFLSQAGAVPGARQRCLGLQAPTEQREKRQLTQNMLKFELLQCCCNRFLQADAGVTRKVKCCCCGRGARQGSGMLGIGSCSTWQWLGGCKC